MEEQKNAKEIKIGASVKEKPASEQKKYSYDELNDICNKLFQDNRYLKYQLQQAQEVIRSFDRLTYLLKVLELSKTEGYWKFDDNFLNKCIEEVQVAMTIPSEENDEESKES